jgi:hypothetical protein
MSCAISLLAKLRAAGVSISSQHGRLIVEAATGIVTQQLLEELAKYKGELISALQLDVAYRHRQDHVNESRAPRHIR